MNVLVKRIGIDKKFTAFDIMIIDNNLVLSRGSILKRDNTAG